MTPPRSRILRCFALSTVLAWALAASSVVAQETALYVSPQGNDANPGTETQPFRTLERARSAVRALNASMTQDITVYLRGGDYSLASTFALDASDSGADGFAVRWVAYPGETPRITGGQRITGWSAAGNGVYRAYVGTLRFRQVWVNGTRAVRARRPDVGQYLQLRSWDTSGRRVEIAATEIANWARLGEVELIVPGKGVNQANLRVSSFTTSGSSAYVVPSEPERTRIFQQSYPPKEVRPYFFENAFEFLDGAGEWYLNRATSELFYKPRAGEDMGTAEVVVPRLERLLELKGTLSAPIHDIEFRGITFEHTGWLSPDSTGFIGDQASTEFIQPLPSDQISSYPSRPLPAAVHVEAAQFVHFERNVFRRTGASAVNFFSGVQDSSFVGNVVTDVSGSGVSVDLALEGNPSDARKICRRVTVANNYIAHVGRDYYQSVGIMAAYTDAVAIEHNELHDISYSGISVGWGWANVDNAARDNLVRYNEIYDVLNTMADGGGVYTLSKQPGTLVAENYVHDIARYGWHGSYPIAGVFLDEGSNLITVRDNVLVDTGDRGINTNAIGSGNTFSNNDGTSSATIANAGLEPAYSNIRPPAAPVGLAFGFDENSGTTAQDATGSGRVAQLLNGAGWAAGKFGSSVQLDGVDDYVAVSDPGLPTTDFTWMAWVRPDTLSAFQTLLEAQGGSVAEIEINVVASGAINVYFDGTSAITTATTLAVGVWSHVALRRQGSTLQVFVNGAADPITASDATALSFASCPLLLGVDADSGCTGALNGYFDGRIDEVRIHGRALSQSEIQQQMGTPISSPDPGGGVPAPPTHIQLS